MKPASFWKIARITKDEMKQIQTTCIRLPCGDLPRKTHVHQFRRAGCYEEYRAANAGETAGWTRRSWRNLLEDRELYQERRRPSSRSILNLTWNYSVPSSPPLAEVLKEINGKALRNLRNPATKQQIKPASSFPAFC